MIRAIAIDDEPIALKVVEEHASKIPFLQLEESFTDAFAALEFLQNNKVDLIFLDINMPDISGLDLLKATDAKFQIVFTTAYSEYAVESYEHNAADYLLKPFEFGRFLKAVMKVKEGLKQAKEDYFFVKSGYEYIRINFQDLLFIKGEGNYLKLVEKERSTLTRMTFEEVSSQIPESFVQVHRSFIINSQLVEKLEKHQAKVGEHQVPINPEGYEKLKALVIK
ncbi:LytTR family DNA-binding domain-containing protein [uncultured Roseivirga sp.]|uniref:LytR/AlgR family response regulator transcription factor n=1 Tax=uncultured Roseivirga sp. TaxID=543088 RepID=UPI000D79D774|nr:LytTR family DNA-binding domain-containing protein [uncultured Roseivirga sp.]PWL30696.1 MAG: DNA-binding response regulator [Roseivirga sp. XM-24bin3]